MANKKSSKPIKITKEVLDTTPSPVVASGGSFARLPKNPPMPAEQYLMSIGTRPQHITPMATWARGKGLSVATFSQWQDLFKGF